MNSQSSSEARHTLRRLTREEAESILLREGLPSPLMSRKRRERAFQCDPEARAVHASQGREGNGLAADAGPFARPR